MPAKAMELKSPQTAGEIEAGNSTVELQLPLTLSGWSLTGLFALYGPRPVVVRSADDSVFIGEVTETDELARVVTVELS